MCVAQRSPRLARRYLPLRQLPNLRIQRPNLRWHLFRRFVRMLLTAEIAKDERSLLLAPFALKESSLQVFDLRPHVFRNVGERLHLLGLPGRGVDILDALKAAEGRLRGDRDLRRPAKQRVEEASPPARLLRLLHRLETLRAVTLFRRHVRRALGTLRHRQSPARGLNRVCSSLAWKG